MANNKHQDKTPGEEEAPLFGVGKYEGKGPYVPSGKEIKEAIENAKKMTKKKPSPKPGKK